VGNKRVGTYPEPFRRMAVERMLQWRRDQRYHLAGKGGGRAGRQTSTIDLTSPRTALIQLHSGRNQSIPAA
jgi:hypothetical protein